MDAKPLNVLFARGQSARVTTNILVKLNVNGEI